ncbi:MAG: pyridine nucleotide-disulfide oxidoreductase, partial [Clostridia bacterium]|nr:pyridine nucleotide-disulfide oxidoreductase [Clostridia bacterium]
SEEASRAGAGAARFVKEGAKGAAFTKITAKDGVRYTVPQRLDINNMDDKVTVRFRVADVYRDMCVALYYDGKCVKRVPRRVMAPGEMEELVIKKESFAEGTAAEIVICLEARQ